MTLNRAEPSVQTRYSVEEFAAFAAAKKTGSRILTAAHPACPAAVLALLATDSSAAVRRSVAANVLTPVEQLSALATDSDRKTREMVAANPATSASVLLVLLDDPLWSVRWAVVEHPNANLEVQHAICASPDAVLRGLLGEVQGLDAEISARLLVDPVPNVRHRLATRTTDPAVMAALLADDSNEARQGLTMNLLITAEQSRLLARDRTWQVRAVLAQQTGLPDDVYELLADDRSEAVRDWIASTGYAPRHVMDRLTGDKSEDVAEHARSRIILGPVPIDGPVRVKL